MPAVLDNRGLDGLHVVMTTAVMIKRACGTRGEPDTAQNSSSTSRCHNTAATVGGAYSALKWIDKHSLSPPMRLTTEAHSEWASPPLRERRISLGDHGEGSHVLRVGMGCGGYPTSVVERAGIVLGGSLWWTLGKKMR